MRRYLKEFEDEYMVYRGTVQARPPLSSTSQVPPECAHELAQHRAFSSENAKIAKPHG